MKRAFISILLASQLITQSGFSAEITAPKTVDVDTAVTKVTAAYKSAGTIVALMKNGEPILVRSYGYADLENSVPITEDTIFQSGSVGKMFTSAALLLLEREGKIDLNSSLLSFFPDGPDYWKDITVRQIMRHRSGIGRLYGPGAPEIFKLTEDYNEAELAKIIGSTAKLFEAGTNYEYSNAGYVLLGIIIHKASGSFYGDYLREKVFLPLGMNTTAVNEPFAIIPHRARGYQEEGNKLKHAMHVSRSLSQTADGSLVFSIKDLIAWEKSLVKETLFSAKEQNVLSQGVPYPDGTKGVTNYGDGWETYTLRGQTLRQHTGTWQGFKTYFARYPKDNIAIAVLANSENANPQMIGRRVLELVSPDYALYRPLPDQSKAAAFNNLVTKYLNGKLAPELTSRTAHHLRNTQQIERYRNEIDFQKVVDLKVVDQRAYNDVLVESAIFKSSENKRASIYRVDITYDEKRKILDISFQNAFWLAE